MKPDLYQTITTRIVDALEQGTRPWMQPWAASHAAGSITRPLRHNGKPYQGINVLLLWMAAAMRGYSAPLWMTYKQAQSLGAQVRKGEKGSAVTYADRMTKQEQDAATGETSERSIYFLKQYTVFNVEQIDGLPAHYTAPAPETPRNPDARCEAAEAFFAALGADIRHGGDRAFYMPSQDRVQMPPFETFTDAESYYATLGHECIHWTKHETRLARDFGRQRFGDEGYAQEELVAELGAAFVAADLGLALEPRPDHASYIASWLKVLKNDKRAIFTAATHAQKALDYLHSLQPQAASEKEASTEDSESMERAA
jgi:antirestriction protein ArdC